MEEEITVEVTLTWRVLAALAALAVAAAIVAHYRQLDSTLKKFSAGPPPPFPREAMAEITLDKEVYKRGDPVRLRVCLLAKVEKILTLTIEEPSGLVHTILAKPESTCISVTVPLSRGASPGEYRITVMSDGKLLAIKVFKVEE